MRIRIARSLVRPTPRLPAALLALLLAACDSTEPADPVASLELSAATSFVDVGDTLRVRAVALTTRGDEAAASRITWSSSDEAVARVEGGLVHGVAPGSATITATAGDLADEWAVTVERPVGFFAVMPGSVTLLPGRTAAISWRFGESDGVPETHSIRFESSDPAVAAVGEDGVVEGRAPGEATITVRAGLRAEEVPVFVEEGAGYAVALLPGLGAESVARAVNRDGLVAGLARTPDDVWHAMVWEDGVPRRIAGELGRAYNEAVAVNDDGVVVGNSRSGECIFFMCAPGRTQAWSWRGGVLTELGVESSSLVTDVNGAGVVSGYTFGYGFHTTSGEAFLWSADGIRRLGIPERPNPSNQPSYQSTMSAAAAVNDAGKVAGWVSGYADARSATIWDGTATAVNAEPASQGVDVNQRGVVLARRGGGGSCDAFLWDAGGTTCIGALQPSGSYVGRPYALDDEGRVVGGAVTSTLEPYAFLWRDGRLIDLNALVAESEWRLEAATGINEQGQIVGWARHRESGMQRAVRLDPLP